MEYPNCREYRECQKYRDGHRHSVHTRLHRYTRQTQYASMSQYSLYCIDYTVTTMPPAVFISIIQAREQTKDEAKTKAVNRMLEKLENIDNSKNMSDDYALLRKYCTSRFNEKHLFRATPEANQFRFALANYFHNKLTSHRTIRVTGLSLDEFINGFAMHLQPKSVWRIKRIISYDNFGNNKLK